jgi:hypothetical protein
MDDNLARHNATGRDEPRPDATGPDHDYSLTIEQAADRYATAGHPRTIRTLQRYCASGHLDCQKIATTFGDKYLVAPYSVTRHIGQINEVIAFTERTTSRDEPRPDATRVVPQPSHEKESSPPATSPDRSRQDATGNREVKEGDSRYIGQLETRIEEKDEVIDLLRDQLKTKDQQLAAASEQLAAASERDRETNILIQGLQNMVLALEAPEATRTPRDVSVEEQGTQAHS